RHPIFVEMHDENVQRVAGDLLRLDRQNLADAMGGVNHEIPGAEAQFFGILLGMLLVLFLFHCRRHLALRGGVIGLCRARRTTLRYKRGSPAPIGSATRTHVTGISTRAPRAICYN